MFFQSRLSFCASRIAAQNSTPNFFTLEASETFFAWRSNRNHDSFALGWRAVGIKFYHRVPAHLANPCTFMWQLDSTVKAARCRIIFRHVRQRYFYVPHAVPGSCFKTYDKKCMTNISQHLSFDADLCNGFQELGIVVCGRLNRDKWHPTAVIVDNVLSCCF